MNGFCPNCEKESQLELINRIEEYNVRGEAIQVEVEFFHCLECGEVFENPKSSIDPYDVAYREYRSRKGMLQPEEIRGFRNRLGFTQKEFSKLIGIGIATLNRYENGALQSEAHNRNITLIMDPRNLLSLISSSQGIVSDVKREKIIHQLTEEANISFNEIIKEYFGNYTADQYSGYKKLDLDKFFEVIKYFCSMERIFKTKLMKLMFYSDFGYFKKYSVSITGARYSRLPFGPVPDQFERWLLALSTDERGIRKEEDWKHDYPGEVYISNIAPDMTIFDPSELKVIASVMEKFKDINAKQISEISHQEKGYLETENAHLISYIFANELSQDF